MVTTEQEWRERTHLGECEMGPLIEELRSVAGVADCDSMVEVELEMTGRYTPADPGDWTTPPTGACVEVDDVITLGVDLLDMSGELVAELNFRDGSIDAEAANRLAARVSQRILSQFTCDQIISHFGDCYGRPKA